MMKKILFFLLVASVSISVAAQTPRKPNYRPDWFYNTPHPENATYLYVVEHGEGSTKREALNQAMARVFQSTATRIGSLVSTEEINRAVQAGTDYSVISQNMKVPIHKVCEFPIQDTTDYSWTMYVLCQVAKSGSITPEFEPCDVCNAHTVFDKQMQYYRESIANAEKNAIKNKRKKNGVAFVESMFLPGLGQMVKGHGAEGAFTLIGELGLIGGGVATYYIAKDELALLKTGTLDLNGYNTSAQKYNDMRTVTYTLFAAAGALYVFNLCRACLATDKKSNGHLKNLSFYPTVVPMENQQMAMGVGMSVNF